MRRKPQTNSGWRFQMRRQVAGNHSRRAEQATRTPFVPTSYATASHATKCRRGRPPVSERAADAKIDVAHRHRPSVRAEQPASNEFGFRKRVEDCASCRIERTRHDDPVIARRRLTSWHGSSPWISRTPPSFDAIAFGMRPASRRGVQRVTRSRPSTTAHSVRADRSRRRAAWPRSERPTPGDSAPRDEPRALEYAHVLRIACGEVDERCVAARGRDPRCVETLRRVWFRGFRVHTHADIYLPGWPLSTVSADRSRATSSSGRVAPARILPRHPSSGPRAERLSARHARRAREWAPDGGSIVFAKIARWFERSKAEGDALRASAVSTEGDHAHPHRHEDGIVHVHGHDHDHPDHDHDHSHEH